MRWRLKYSPAEIDYLREKGGIVGGEVKPENVVAWNAFMSVRGNVCMAEIAAWFDIYGIIDGPQRARITQLVLAMGAEENNGGVET